jgi:DNA-binding transcriptional regulator LsrR (DeoR family)
VFDDVAEEAWVAGSSTPSTDRLRLLTKVSRMYHEQGARQPEIAQQLNLSQARVSRLLKEATALGIVRTVVVPPFGVHTDLEDDICARYGLRDVVVVDADSSQQDVTRALGAAAATYLDSSLKGGDLIGISSWSATLIAAVDVMKAKHVPVAERVVQIVGGLGSPEVQMQATRLTGRLAELTGARPVFVPSPGLVGTPNLKRALTRDPAIQEVMAHWRHLTLALLGIGSLEPSPLLLQSGNAIAAADQHELRSLGAVGDVCFRFFDAEGTPVRSKLDQRIIGIEGEDLRQVDRRVGVAGGLRKVAAVRGALLGGWVNILITDVAVARALVEPIGLTRTVPVTAG